MNYRNEAPPELADFLSYHETAKNHSQHTVDEYFLDLRNFFRYIKRLRGLVPELLPMDEISIKDVNLELIRSVTLSDVYDYMSYLARERPQHTNSDRTDYGLEASSRARKVASIRSFYKYLQKFNKIEENPVQDLEPPKLKRSLPKYLTLDECTQLLQSVTGSNSARDYCILTLFLNCGLRISELVNLNVSDIHGDTIRVLGKGNKERILYLNESCQAALENWLTERNMREQIDKQALFVTSRRKRITRAAVHKLVKKRLAEAGLDADEYSSHKLRHTAATLMLQNGVDVRTLQEMLGHDNLNTTQIYTHVSSESLQDAAEQNPLAKLKPPQHPRQRNKDENE